MPSATRAHDRWAPESVGGNAGARYGPALVAEGRRKVAVKRRIVGALSSRADGRQRSAVNKARLIRETLDMVQADPDWWRPSKMGDNPLAWRIIVNNLVVDARKLPVAIQEELVRRKLIPRVYSAENTGP